MINVYIYIYYINYCMFYINYLLFYYYYIYIYLKNIK